MLKLGSSLTAVRPGAHSYSLALISCEMKLLHERNLPLSPSFFAASGLDVNLLEYIDGTAWQSASVGRQLMLPPIRPKCIGFAC